MFAPGRAKSKSRYSKWPHYYRIAVPLAYMCFFFVEFNHKAIFQGYMKYNVAQKYGVHNLVAVDSCATEMT